MRIRRHLAILGLWVCGILLPALCVMANPEGISGKGEGAITLCEIYVMDLKLPAYPDFYSLLAQTAKNHCLVLVHLIDGNSEVKDPSMIPAPGITHPSFPVIVVDGKTSLLASPESNWQDDLHKILQQGVRREKWRLSVYLSSNHTRENKPGFDFSVCNMEKSGLFNGIFTLWMAEKRGVASGRKFWVATKRIVGNSIRNLPPSGVAGCPLPDRFSLPDISDGKQRSVIAIINTMDFQVQAVALETLPR